MYLWHQAATFVWCQWLSKWAASEHQNRETKAWSVQVLCGMHECDFFQRTQLPLQPQISRDSITSQPSSNMGHAYSGGIANGGNLSPKASHELRATSVDRLSSADSLSLPPHVKV